MDTSTLMMMGTGIQAGAGIARGYSARQAGQYNADALDRQATDEVAGAQRASHERRVDTERVLSRARALGAASGAGSGPSLLDIMGDTVQAGEYRAQAEQYAGEARARSLRDRGRIARWEGENAFRGSILEGIGTIAVGAGRHRLHYGSTTAAPGGPGGPPGSPGTGAYMGDYSWVPPAWRPRFG
jgi:hypothetical protein